MSTWRDAALSVELAPMFDVPKTGREYPSKATCGNVCPGHQNLFRVPMHKCQRPIGHAGDHQTIRKRDFFIISAWNADGWVTEPPAPKVSR